MYLGPIDVDLLQIATLCDKIPKGACVLELGGASGTYSVGIRKRTDHFIILEPDARLVHCILANSSINEVEITVCNAWVTERKLVLIGKLMESDGSHHPDDAIRLLSWKEFRETVGYDFTHIVVHRPDFFDQFNTDYPEIVQSCTVLKTFEC